MIAMKHYEEFFAAYLEAALWSTNDESTPEGGEPLDTNYTASDIHGDTLAYLGSLAHVFYTQQGPFIAARVEAGASTGGEWTVWEQAGHDLWLTQNGHGAGFWDRPESLWGPYADKFTEAAEALGEVDLYVGDDGAIHA